MIAVDSYATKSHLIYDCGRHFNNVLLLRLICVVTWVGSKVKIFRTCYVLVIVNMYRHVNSNILQGSAVSQTVLGGPAVLSCSRTFPIVYMCHKLLWKSVGSRQSYCNNKPAYFLTHPFCPWSSGCNSVNICDGETQWLAFLDHPVGLTSTLEHLID